LWLSPEQFAILPISEKYQEYAQQVYDRLIQEELRGFIDNRDEKIGRKIRDAEVRKVSYMLIVGEKEQENEIVSVRKHGAGDVGNMTLDTFVEHFKEIIAETFAQ
jgi:threonyl-tRNA synthetase